MDLGRELVACALREGTLRPFVEAGISEDWLTDKDDLSREAIFSNEDRDAWRTLSRHWDLHGKVPSVDLFRRSHPEEAYRLPESGYEPAELVDIFQQDRRKFLTQVAVSDLADLICEERYDDAIELMELAQRVIKNTHANRSVVVSWDSPEYDVEARINRKVPKGILTGIPGFDDQEGFAGFQAGWLVCYLGRAKAGKTSFALLSALQAWLDGKRVMFVSFEIAAGRTPDEPGIADRLDCLGAHVDMLRYMMGKLGKDDQRELREFRESCTDDVFKIIQPTSRYTVTDLESDIDRFEPDVVYIDGFYFMTDRQTGHRGSHWEGHDNLSEELATLAMAHAFPVVVTHQVREKQLMGKKGKGIDDGAMMGGTGIIMAASLVLGVDADEDHLRTLTCTRARLKYLTSVHGVWNWATCQFTEQEPVDEEQFGYGKDNHADPPF